MASFESDLSEIKCFLQSIDRSLTLHSGSTRNDVGQHERQEHSQDGEDTTMISYDTSVNGFSASTCSREISSGDERNGIHSLSDVPGNGQQSDVPHPHAQVISFLWWKYLEVVDPVLKIFHTTSIQRLVVDAISGQKGLTMGENFLMFSIYYASVVVMSTSECFKEVKEERQVLLERYRIRLDQFLSLSDFMETADLAVLQAFVIYLAIGTYDVNGPDVHSMVGLAVGRAIKLGLHRDGEGLGVPLFETEMRRRLWWQICTLDVRTAQDHRSDPCILEHSFNTKLPANISDVSLDPDMSKYPAIMHQRTEMLFSLVQFELEYFLRQVAFSDKFVQENSYTALPYSRIRKAIDLFQERIQKQYISHCDPSIPLGFMMINLGQLVIEKMRLKARKSSEDHGRNQEQVGICIRISQIAHRMRAHEKGQKWLWLLERQLELDALTFLLTYLCGETEGANVELTWEAVNDLYDYWKRSPEHHFHRQWTCIVELRSQALDTHNSVPNSD
ncbi:hypothetical protein EYB25_009331 [Talaromyces marneffei]|nr:hypothetical protein EYB25_009331 [Talaromyces marneffei]